MVKSIILIIVIVLAIVFSGCLGGQDSKVATSIQNVVQKSDYRIQVTETKYIDSCFTESKEPFKRQPCILINLYFENNKDGKVDFNINSNSIVTKDGKQFEGLQFQFQLIDSCRNDRRFSLFPNAHQNVGLCYPSESETKGCKLLRAKSPERLWLSRLALEKVL